MLCASQVMRGLSHSAQVLCGLGEAGKADLAVLSSTGGGGRLQLASSHASLQHMSCFRFNYKPEVREKRSKHPGRLFTCAQRRRGAQWASCAQPSFFPGPSLTPLPGAQFWLLSVTSRTQETYLTASAEICSAHRTFASSRLPPRRTGASGSPPWTPGAPSCSSARSWPGLCRPPLQRGDSDRLISTSVQTCVFGPHASVTGWRAALNWGLDTCVSADTPKRAALTPAPHSRRLGVGGRWPCVASGIVTPLFGTSSVGGQEH